MVKALPILFSGRMIRALMEGRKTQTRRVVKPQPEPIGHGWHWTGHKPNSPYGACGSFGGKDPEKSLYFWMVSSNPYGLEGDLLWVRETFADVRGMGFDLPFYYAADGTTADGEATRKAYGIRWRPSIHMPRVASRLTLRIKDVRVERLNDISSEDAEAEGVICDWSSKGFTDHYRELWNRINGAGAWSLNPCVWVISFEVIKANVDQVLKGAA